MNLPETDAEFVNPEKLFDGAKKNPDPWDLSYKKSLAAQPSWAQHGMPPLTDRFIDLTRTSDSEGIHLDIGCGNGIKTVNFALAGLRTVGIDISKEAIREANFLLDGHKLPGQCAFVEGSCLDLKFAPGSISSVSDILCFTHIEDKNQLEYLKGVHSILRPNGYFMLTLFSDRDEHFHGHPVSKKYRFHYDPSTMEEGYEHYEGMYNFHFGVQNILETFSGLFDVVGAIHVRHPLYQHRYLWNVILQKIDSYE